MEIEMSGEEQRDDEENPFATGFDMSSEAVVDNSEKQADVKCDHALEQGKEVNSQEKELSDALLALQEEPRDDEENPNAQYVSSSGGTSYDQTGQLRHETPDKNSCDDETIEDKWGVSFLGPICWVVVAIVLLWAFRLWLPLIQAFAESSGVCSVWYGIMCFLPLALIVVAIVCAIRIFISLPAGVDCKYSPDKKKDLRNKLIGKYLKGFTENKSLRKLIGGDIGGKAESLCKGGNGNIDEWFSEYKKFQDTLINRAEKERDKYANAIALITITSPKSQLDVMGTLLFSTRMVLSIARIFNKRTSKLKAFELTISWAMNIYLSGEMQKLGAKVGGMLGNGVNSMLRLVGFEKAGKVVGQIVRVTAGLGIEGGINKKLAMFLGDRAIKAFVAVKGL